MNGNRSVKQQLEEKPAQREKGSPWVGFVQLGMVCVTIVAVVFIIWGQC